VLSPKNEVERLPYGVKAGLWPMEPEQIKKKGMRNYIKALYNNRTQPGATASARSRGKCGLTGLGGSALGGYVTGSSSHDEIGQVPTNPDNGKGYLSLMARRTWRGGQTRGAFLGSRRAGAIDRWIGMR